MVKISSVEPGVGRDLSASELQLCSPAQARALLHPTRVELLRLLAEPRGIRALAKLLRSTPQKVHYHIKYLEESGLVHQVATRKVRALTESIYQAVAQSFAPSPELMAMLGGGNRSRDALSKSYMLALAEDLVTDAARHALSQDADASQHPTLSIAAQVELSDPARRSDFLAELQGALLAVAEKYGAAGSGTPSNGTYKLVLACYPEPEENANQVS